MQRESLLPQLAYCKVAVHQARDCSPSGSTCALSRVSMLQSGGLAQLTWGPCLADCPSSQCAGALPAGNSIACCCRSRSTPEYCFQHWSTDCRSAFQAPIQPALVLGGWPTGQGVDSYSQEATTFVVTYLVDSSPNNRCADAVVDSRHQAAATTPLVHHRLCQQARPWGAACS